MQLGAGLAIKEIRGHAYLYFWEYEPRSWGSRRVWTYIGPVGRTRTQSMACQLLIQYHMKVRREIDRRIERLGAAFGAPR